MKGQLDYDADYHAVSLLKGLADEFSISLLVITHTRKLDADDFLDAVIGTHGCTGAADGLLVLKRARCSDTATLSITGRDIEEERELVIEWHKPTCTWHLTDANADDVKLTPERRRIVAILRAATPLSSKQIAETYHSQALTRDSDEWRNTRKTLSLMVRDGQLLKDEKSGYSLAPNFEKNGNTSNTSNTGNTGNTGNTPGKTAKMCYPDELSVTHPVTHENPIDSLVYDECVTVLPMLPTATFTPVTHPDCPIVLPQLSVTHPVTHADCPAVDRPVLPVTQRSVTHPVTHPDCRQCRNFRQPSTTCEYSLTGITTPTEPPCGGQHFSLKEIKS